MDLNPGRAPNSNMPSQSREGITREIMGKKNLIRQPRALLTCPRGPGENNKNKSSDLEGSTF